MNEVVVLSVDKLYAELICQRLRSSSPEIQAEPIVPHPRYLSRLLDEIGPRPVLVDLQSVAVCRNALMNSNSGSKRILLVPEARPEHIDVAKKIAAGSIIQTSMEPDLLNYALVLAIKGGSFYPASLWDKAVFRTAYARDGSSTLAGVDISRREKEIIGALSMGSSNKVIAEDLGLSEGTVKVYLSKLCRKYNVSNRTQLLLKAMGDEKFA